MAKKDYLPSNLSYSRGIELSEGIMSGIVSASGQLGIESLFGDRATGFKRAPVEVDVTTVRGTIANFDKKSAQERVDQGSKSINNANIARIEQALLPADADRLLVEFTARFNGNSRKPHIQNSPDFVADVARFLDGYQKQGGYRELATRYFLRIANASWLWRNRDGEDLQVRVKSEEDVVVFHEDDFDFRGERAQSLSAILDEPKRAQAEKIVDKIAKALAGETGTVALKCSAMVTLGKGSEVYPSQEFGSEASETVPTGGDKPTKILSKIRDSEGRLVATMHARKINNAIRTIDTWHNVPGVGAIAVEMFGAHTQQSVAHRVGKGVDDRDFYDLFKDVKKLADELAAGGALRGDHHFVVACLTRGGVFGFGTSK